MKLAKDFRSIARESLTGKWSIAILVSLVASILGVAGGSLGINLKFNSNNRDITLEIARQPVFSTSSSLEPEISAFIASTFVNILIIILLISIIYFTVISFIGVGYAKFNLNLVDKKDVSFESLFAYWPTWKTAAIASLLQTIYVLFWMMLFIIPGFIASYSYAMTDYILADNPNLTASEAIKKSKKMMSGNRWRLFCLHTSFIGWDILASLTFGIGNLWLNPYRHTATAAFYREISGTKSNKSHLVN